MMTESPQLNQVELDSQFGFASDDDSHVPYMKRTRDWYMALGYNNPYRYAHYIDVPFQPLKKALSESTVTLMTTAAPFQPDKGPQGPGAPYNSAAKFFVPYEMDTSKDHDVRVSHVAIDCIHTSMEDSNSWFPLPLMREFASQGRFKLSPYRLANEESTQETAVALSGAKNSPRSSKCPAKQFAGSCP